MMEPATGVVDAFLGGQPPWQLFTREAFALYRNHLRQGGAVVFNLIGSHTWTRLSGPPWRR